MGTELFIAADVFSVELLATKFQWSAQQIGQDSSIYRPLQKRERAGKEYGCFPFV